MTWQPIFTGSGEAPATPPRIPAAPSWRVFPVPETAARFLFPDGLVEAVNAAVLLRRPLLVTGAPGSGKSSIIQAVATELGLGPVLRWNVTSRSTLPEALYRYDVLGRIHEQQLKPKEPTPITPFLQLGPLGTAFVASVRPRALLIDEFDKSDFDLPGDLLNVLERGEFEIAELERLEPNPVRTEPEKVRVWDGGAPVEVPDGHVRCTEFPFILITSNGERDFPPPFLRRCIRFTMPPPTKDLLRDVVAEHLGPNVSRSAATQELIQEFLARVTGKDQLAVDQLLNAVFLLADVDGTGPEERERIKTLVLRELSRA